jgi:hypothetical protein
MVIETAKPLDVQFRNKADRTQGQAVRRFVASHGIVHKVDTHQSQESAALMQVEASKWIEKVRPLLKASNRDERFIISMEQTPIYFFPNHLKDDQQTLVQFANLVFR